MARFRLLIEYAGTRYRGWQIQTNARTVAGELSRVIAQVTARDRFELYGSGRTDAGVHAVAQVAHLEVETRLGADALRFAINDGLPHDIDVVSLERAPARFHARHGAVGRSYLYQVCRRRTAFAKPYVWWVKDRLDVAAMIEAARTLVGLHDFRAFTDADPGHVSTRVQIHRLDVVESGALVLIRVRGSHFLWKMVRRIVGVLVEVGRRRLGAAEVAALLERPSSLPARLTAPPSGLFLERVLYEGDTPDDAVRAVFPVP